MKKLLLGITGCCSVLLSFAQLPVSTSPQNKKAVLEELTGIYCYWCPAGHKIANNLKASRPPGSVVLINCHCTGYSTPIFDDPNYKTPEGDSLAEMPGMSVPGVPAGAVNRHQWPGHPSMPVTRNLWSGYIDQILTQPSYVNLALEGTLNITTRLLTVTVQAYYTGNSPVSTNKLTVVLLEDTVIGKQGGAFVHYPEQTNADGSYRHHHMLRKMLTSPATGEPVAPTTMGSIINRTYTFTIPTGFKNTPTSMGNLRLAGFIAESNTEIITGAYGPITLTGFAHPRDAALTGVTAEQEVCAGRVNPKVSIYNSGSTAVTQAALSYKVNSGAPASYTFSGYIAPATTKKIELPEISFSPATWNTLSVTVAGVNGINDQNSTNNTYIRDSIRISANIAGDTNMRMEYTQTNACNGSAWKLYDETTNTLIAEDGPFPDVPYMVIETRIKNFNVRRNSCYTLVLENSKFISDYNLTIGNYKLFSGGALLINTTGIDTGRAQAWFRTGPYGLGIGNTEFIRDLMVTPNPASDIARLHFTLRRSMPVNITVYSAVGNVLFSQPAQQYSAGVHSLSIPVHHLASGLYLMRISTEAGAAVTKFSISRQW